MVEPARNESADDAAAKRPPRVLPTGEIAPVSDPSDSVAALTSGTRRYRDDEIARRPPLRTRSWRAYWTTFRGIGSYLWLRFRARFPSDTWSEPTLPAITF